MNKFHDSSKADEEIFAKKKRMKGNQMSKSARDYRSWCWFHGCCGENASIDRVFSNKSPQLASQLAQHVSEVGGFTSLWDVLQ
jgi:hypothetical protein